MRASRRLALLLAVLAAISPAADPGFASRVGFYQWSGAHRIENGEDLLTESRRRTTALGSKVFRFYVGSRFDYVKPVYSPDRFRADTIDGPLTPAKIMALPRYRAVIDDPALDTVWLTVYTARDYGAGPDDLNLLRPWGDPERETESTQIAELCRWLYREFGAANKTIVIANNEADEKLLEIANYTANPALAIRNLTEWINTRHATIEAARNENPAARLHIVHAFEISLVNLRIASHNGRFIKTPIEQVPPGAESWSALHNVVPNIKFDLISYSSYESANSPYQSQDPNAPPDETANRLTRDLNLIREAAQPSLSPYGAKQFGTNFVAVGELGYARDRFERLPTGGVLPRVYHALSAALNWGAPYVILWQVFDAPRLGNDAFGYGVYDRQGNSPTLNAPEGACNSLSACLGQAFENGIAAWDRAASPD
jgi:hypothetical protein